MLRPLADLIADDAGQDLVEYALLTSAIGFACIAVFDTLLAAIGTAYGSWETGTDNLWDPPAPSGS